jgi:hypothetical protein
MKKTFHALGFIGACILACAADSFVPEAHGLPVPEPVHVCIDSEHIECDAACTCDGFECKQDSKKAKIF